MTKTLEISYIVSNLKDFKLSELNKLTLIINLSNKFDFSKRRKVAHNLVKISDFNEEDSNVLNENIASLKKGLECSKAPNDNILEIRIMLLIGMSSTELRILTDIMKQMKDMSAEVKKEVGKFIFNIAKFDEDELKMVTDAIQIMKNNKKQSTAKITNNKILRAGDVFQIETPDSLSENSDKASIFMSFFINLINGATVYEDAEHKKSNKGDVELFIINNNKLLFSVVNDSIFDGIFTEKHIQKLIQEECFKEELKQISEFKADKKYDDVKNVSNQIKTEIERLLGLCFNELVNIENIEKVQNLDMNYYVGSRKRVLQMLEERVRQTT